MTDEYLFEKIRPELRGKKKSDISVVVGLSGGVDSSVSAYLLQKQVIVSYCLLHKINQIRIN